MTSNKWLLGALGVVLFLMLAVLEIPLLHDFFHLSPLGAGQWVWIIILSLAPLPIVEAVKRLFGKLL
jgi:Ca2+-transporting ATPase